MGSLTAEFPDDREPERQPEAKPEFDTVSVTDAQAKAEEDRVRKLESERALKAEMHLTPGGTLEQGSHEAADDDRQKEINALREKINNRSKSEGRGR